MKQRAYDLFGNIAIVKFPKATKVKDKKQFSNKLLKANKSVTTVLEKTGKFKGRLRKMQTRYLVGKKTKEVLYKENRCVFRFNVDSTYFSPRLSNERKEIAGKVKKGDRVLVMFAGVAPYPIVIAKNSKAEKVVSVEINREANKYAKLNVELNKLKKRVEVVQGDVRRVSKKIRNKFDMIVMPRPRLKENFLKESFMLSKKGTRIFYYDFCNVKETGEIVEKIKAEAKKARKRIRILKVKSAGEIAPYKIRVRIDFKIL